MDRLCGEGQGEWAPGTNITSILVVFTQIATLSLLLVAFVLDSYAEPTATQVAPDTEVSVEGESPAPALDSATDLVPPPTLGEPCSPAIECETGSCSNDHCAPSGFVYIPPGTFMMGSPDDESGRDDNEIEHLVSLTNPFYLQTHEVTQAEWRALMGNNPSNFSSCGDSCPVESVNWYEALTYANALSREEGLDPCYDLIGRSGTLGGGCAGVAFCTGDFEYSTVRFNGLDCGGYRLPTESEWEYASRAGSKTALYTGAVEIVGHSAATVLDHIAWYGGNSGVTYSGGYDCSDWEETQGSATRCGTHSVGLKIPNVWGLYDMLGNVSEWCWDGYWEYPTGIATDPKGSAIDRRRVYRGGGWLNVARFTRSAFRDWDSPVFRYNDLGFRIARSVPTAPTP